jgi:hypothetical protein
MEPGLKRLSRELARAEEELLQTFDIEAQRSRFLWHAVHELPKSRARAPRIVACALLAAASAFALFWALGSTPGRFEIAGERGRVGAFIAAPEHASIPLSFSDGSEISLRARARARVLRSNEHGAHLVLERGALGARIVHQPGTRFQVDAGPYQVHVIGTRFEVSWEDARFELELQEGIVRVQGPGIPEGRMISAGERLSLGRERSAPLASQKQSDPPSIRTHDAPSRTPSSDVAVPPVPTRPSWRTLAARGQHEQAYDALTSLGIGPLLAHASAPDLALIADVARFTGHPAQAERALLALRVRFPRQREAGDAAFLLARLAFDQRSAPGEAAGWFARYLAERPQGPLAREASGRLIECHQRLGDAQRAREAAQLYLDTYPKGPHEVLARAVLGQVPSDDPE